MSRQQMTFQLTYGVTGSQTKCKSCQGTVDTDSLLVGVKSDSMYDPMWYHFRCFWTRCWYRKQMSCHLENYAELAGFTKLKTEDKERFKDALDDMNGSSRDNNSGLKKRSASEGNLLDMSTKRTKGEVVSLPKLTLSATGILSRSSANLSSEAAPVKHSPQAHQGKESAVSRS